MNIFEMLFYLLVFPGLVFSSNAGLFFSWIDRKLAAKLQWRVGPPWYQPWADMLKLFAKEMIIPSQAHRFWFILAPLVSFSAMMIIPLMLPIIHTPAQLNFVGDIIVLLYLLALPGLAAMIAGWSSANPYASIGAQREVVQLFSYELPLLVSIFTIVLSIQPLSLRIEDIVSWQLSHGPFFFRISGFLSFIVALFSVQAKLTLAPFDIPDAKTEIVAGPYTEYSGAALMLFKLSQSMGLFILPWFLSTIFLGGLVVDFTNGTAIVLTSLMAALKLIVVLIFSSVIHLINPRARIDQGLRFFWLPLTVMASIGFILAYYFGL
jgi:NADH-quinone oxidoreductase subunit H